MALHHHHKGQKGHNMVGCNHHILAVVVTILTTYIPRYFFCFLQNLSSQLLLPEGKHKCFQVLRFSIGNLSIRLEGHAHCSKSTEKVGCYSVCFCGKYNVIQYYLVHIITPGPRTDISTIKSCFDFRLVLFFLTKIQCYVTYFLAQQYIFGSPMSALCKAPLLYCNIWPFLTRTVAWTQGIDRLVDI